MMPRRGSWLQGRVSVGESPSWLRHRILIPACEGSNPSSPAPGLLFVYGFLVLFSAVVFQWIHAGGVQWR